MNMKKIYTKPEIGVVEFKSQAPLLNVSKLGGKNPLGWGNPLDDR